MKTVTYVDREGKIISALDWVKKRANDSYRNVRAYKNEKILVEIFWIGKISKCNEVPREHWKPFVVEISMAIKSGNRPGAYGIEWVRDPIKSKTFKSEAESVSFYASILNDQNAIKRLEDYEGGVEITEVGNLLTNLTPLTEEDIKTIRIMSDQDIKKEMAEKAGATKNKNYASW